MAHQVLMEQMEQQAVEEQAASMELMVLLAVEAHQAHQVLMAQMVQQAQVEHPV